MSELDDALLQRFKVLVSENSPDGPTIADDDIRVGDIKALLDEIERLRKERQRLILDHLSSEGQWIEHTGELNAEIEKLKAEGDSERNRLGDECDRLVFEWHDKVKEVEKQRDQCQSESRRSKEELKEFKSFVKEIRDGYDCDTGASGVHAHRCRCCVAGDLLGEPPSVFDQRTRGG